MLKQVSLVLFVALFASGCVMSRYIPLEKNIQRELSEVNANSSLPQDEIYVTAIDPALSKAGGGGLLLALVDSAIAGARQEKLQNQIEPFYEAVDDLDVRGLYADALQKTLIANYGINVVEVATTPFILTDDDLTHIKAKLTAEKGFMYIRMRYTFSADFTNLEVITEVDMWRGGAVSPVYSNTFMYVSNSVAKTDEKPLDLWARNNGIQYRAVIKEGIAQTMRMFDYEMRFPRYADNAESAKTGRSINAGTKIIGGLTVTLDGDVIDEQNARVILRNTEGRLVSIPK